MRNVGIMINIEGKIKIDLYAGSTDMRKGMHGLAMLAEEKLSEKYDKEGLFVFRGKKGDRLKILWWDGQGFCLYYKCMDKGIFAWLKRMKQELWGLQELNYQC
jgi:transposase